MYRKPRRIKKKKSIFGNRFFWLALLFLIFIGIIFYLICFLPVFQIKEIKVIGNQKLSTEDIRNLIEENISQKFLFFNSKSIFLVKSDKIRGEIYKKFPQLFLVNLKRKLPNTLTVEVKERTAIGVWCQNENCFYLDREGIIFEENPGQTEFIIKSEEQKPQAFLGEKVIEENFLESILEIEKKLKENLKIETEELIILTNGRLNVKASESWEIYFNLAGDIEWQLTKLSLVLEKEIPSEKRKSLEYIDLRFGNFAPFKYRTTSATEESP